jgi:hypothetical protein
MLVANAGMTWEYVAASMTLPRLDALQRHWERVPPVEVSVARIAMALGIEWRGSEGEASGEKVGVGDAARDFAAAGLSIGG